MTLKQWREKYRLTLFGQGKDLFVMSELLWDRPGSFPEIFELEDYCTDQLWSATIWLSPKKKVMNMDGQIVTV